MLNLDQKKRIFLLHFRDKKSILSISRSTGHHRTTIKSLIGEFLNTISTLSLYENEYLQNIDRIVLPKGQNHNRESKITPELIDFIKDLLKSNERYMLLGDKGKINNYTDIFFEQRNEFENDSVSYNVVRDIIRKIKIGEM